MSDVAASPELNNLRRGMIMTSVVLAATLYSTTLVIASTLLPQIQGAMAATPDEVAWVMTFNILATAVVTPMTGWLVGCFGRRGVMVGSVLLFTLSTYLCGAAESLETLILWRILQGATGAPVTPLSQTVLFDTFSRQYQRIVTSIYGMTVVLGPIIGPVLGGYLTDMYSWRWAFYLLVPIGLASAIGLQFSMLRDTRRQPVRLDWLGFLSLAAAISFMQLALSRGPRLDWYDSPEVWLETIGAIVAFYVFLAHSLTAKNPFLHLRLLLDRNYALGLALVTVFGMLNVTPMVLLPPLLRQNMGYPDSLIGEILAWRASGGCWIFSREFRRPARSARRHVGRLRLASGLRSLADEHRPQCRHPHPHGKQRHSGRCDRSDLGSADDSRFQHARQRALAGGDVGVSFDAQYRIELLYLNVRCRNGPQRHSELQPPERDDFSVQPPAIAALGNGRLDNRDRPGARQIGARDQPPSRNDWLSACFHALYCRLGRRAAAGCRCPVERPHSSDLKDGMQPLAMA
jgi:MFS family permease